MKAVVFAAGIGSRLKPFTDSHPKALAPVGSDTALGLVLAKLAAAGADGIIVNVHHFAGQVKDYLAGIDLHTADGRRVEIEISDESELLLDTGGALAKIFRESAIVSRMTDDEPIVVHNADILTDFPIAEIVDTKQRFGAAVFVDGSRRTKRYLMFDDACMLRGWTNKATGAVRPEGINPSTLTSAAFDGVHCLDKTMLGCISSYCGTDLRPFSIIDFYIDRCADGKTVAGYTPRTPFRWFDIGTPERLEAAQKFNA